MEMATSITSILAKSPTATSFEALRNQGRNLSHILSPSKFSSSPQVVCDSGRKRASIPFLFLHYSTPMVCRKQSRRNSSSSSSSPTGQSSMEIEPMVESATSQGSATPSRGFGHHVNKLSKWAVSAIFAAIVVWRHDAEVMWAVTGSILNAENSRLLKHVFKQQRPPSASGLKADPGMPSSHAQALGYLTIYAALSLIGWQRLNALSIGVVFAILSCGAYLAWLRVSEGLHTYDQVLVGALVGSVTAAIWFWLWKAIMLKAFASFLWVRIAVSICSLIAIIGFLYFVVRTWHFGEV